MASYSKLSAEELVEEYDSITSTLSGQIMELAEVKIARQWVYYQGYANSHETSVSGRERSGEVAAEEMTADVIRLESSIESLRVLSTFLAELLRHRAG